MDEKKVNKIVLEIVSKVFESLFEEIELISTEDSDDEIQTISVAKFKEIFQEVLSEIKSSQINLDNT